MGRGGLVGGLVGRCDLVGWWVGVTGGWVGLYQYITMLCVCMT